MLVGDSLKLADQVIMLSHARRLQPSTIALLAKHAGWEAGGSSAKERAAVERIESLLLELTPFARGEQALNYCASSTELMAVADSAKRIRMRVAILGQAQCVDVFYGDDLPGGGTWSAFLANLEHVENAARSGAAQPWRKSKVPTTGPHLTANSRKVVFRAVVERLTALGVAAGTGTDSKMPELLQAIYSDFAVVGDAREDLRYMYEARPPRKKKLPAALAKGITAARIYKAK